MQYTDYCDLDGKLVWHVVATTKDRASTRNIADWCAPRGTSFFSAASNPKSALNQKYFGDAQGGLGVAVEELAVGFYFSGL